MCTCTLVFVNVSVRQAHLELESLSRLNNSRELAGHREALKTAYFLSIKEEFAALQHRAAIICANVIELNGYFIIPILFVLSAIVSPRSHKILLFWLP